MARPVSSIVSQAFMASIILSYQVQNVILWQLSNIDIKPAVLDPVKLEGEKFRIINDSQSNVATGDQHNPEAHRVDMLLNQFNSVFFDGSKESSVEYSSIERQYYDTIYYVNYMIPMNFLLTFEYNSGEGKNVDDDRLDTSALPVADRRKCYQHLKLIAQHINESKSNQSNQDLAKNISNDQQTRDSYKLTFEFNNYLNTFGSPSNEEISTGTNAFLGRYSSCLNTRLMRLEEKQGDREQIRMRYCVGNAKLNAWSEWKLAPKANPDYEPFIHFGLCLPESCDTRSLNEDEQLKAFVQQLMLVNVPDRFFNKQLYLDNTYCLPDERSPLRQMDWRAKTLVAIAAMWFLLLLICTYLDEHHSNLKKKKNRSNGILNRTKFTNVVQALSLRRALNDLFLVKPLRPKIISASRCDEQKTDGDGFAKRRSDHVNLDPLAGIKAMVLVFVVLGHSYLYIILSARDKFEFASSELVDSSKFLFIISSNLLIDTMFVISGMLMVYLALKKLKAATRGQEKTTSGTIKPLSFLGSAQFCAMFTLSRYLRLMPLYLLCQLFIRYLMKYISHGPLWDYATSHRGYHLTYSKVEPWSRVLLTTSNMVAFLQTAIPEAWSISVDIQSTIFLGPLILLTVRKHRLAYLLCVLLCLSSLQIGYYACTIYGDFITDEEVSSMSIVFLFRLIKHLSLTYTSILSRVFAFFISVIFGHQLYLYDTRSRQPSEHQQNKKKSYWPEWFVSDNLYIGSIVNSAIIILITSSFHYWNPILANYGITVFTRDRFFFIYTWQRLVWSLLQAIVLLRLITDKQHSLMARFLSLPLWHILSKLSYSILLCHVLILLLRLFSLEQLQSPPPELFETTCIIYIYSLIVALVTYICFEYPIDGLIRLALPFKARKQSDMTAAPPKLSQTTTARPEQMSIV